jgi:uncharacterized protein (DUF1800 family)
MIPISRRDFLKLASIVAGSAALSSCEALVNAAPAYESAARSLDHLDLLGDGPGLMPSEFTLLNRLTYGPTLDERARVAAIGIQAWIEEQLAYESIDDLACDLRLSRIDSLKMSAQDLFDMSDKLFDNQDRTLVPNELRRAALLRQVYSKRQLFERLTEFWTDHFNISVEKGDCFYLKTVDDREVVRKNAMGTFPDLLRASSHSPAMLVYLDNQSNNKEAPNENYAREVMELHTLSVDGGYTQNDVMQLARCLTGWTMKEHFWRGDFTFDPNLHDDGLKNVLGTNIQPNGQAEAEAVFARLAIHPSTAHFLSLKLARRFISETPPDDLISKAATAFIQNQGDIRATLRVILLDGAELVRPKFKRPADFVASALRMLDARTDAGEPLHAYLSRMGQPYFAWPTPDGFPDRSEPWMGNLVPRWQFTLALARNEIKGTTVDIASMEKSDDDLESILDHASRLLLGGELLRSTASELTDSLIKAGAPNSAEVAPIIIAGLLASPAFQWK